MTGPLSRRSWGGTRDKPKNVCVGGYSKSALGPMCDAEKDWHERSFRASGAIKGGDS